ncbi:MAG: M16 family metallopeptidase, partial [Luteibaculum sp.]
MKSLIKMKHITSLLILLSFTLASFAQVDRSKAPEPGPAPKIQIGKSEKFTLENGLKVIVVENNKRPVVSYSLTLDYVPFMEGEVAGNAAIAGSLLRAGTANMSKAEIDKNIDFIGATLVTSSNGIYGQSLSKHSDKLLSIFSDVLLNPSFPAEELEKEKKKTISGLAAAKEDPNAIMSNVSRALTYGKNHPYGELETEKTVGNISVETCKDFYNTYFRPNIAYLVIVGDITRAEAEAKAKKYFGSWKKQEVPMAKLPEVKGPQGKQVCFVPKTGAVQSVINVTYPINLKPGAPDAIPATVMNSILGGGVFSGRLMQNLREDKGYTYGARSSLDTDPYVASFTAYASVRNEVTDSSVTEFLYELDRI